MRSDFRSDKKFDFVFSSLFLHHFTDEQVVSCCASFPAWQQRQCWFQTSKDM